MPLTIITNPTNYQLSKNPIIAEIETDSYVINPGSPAGLIISPSVVDGANAVGGIISFIWALDSVTFTVATTPDDSGYQVRPKLALSDAAYSTQLLVDFAKNYKLTENYTFVLIGTSIHFIARKNGNDYQMYGDFVSLNFGYTKDTFTVADDEEYAPNYKMKADLWMENAFNVGDFSKKATIELDPLNSRCIFDFKTEINAFLQYDLPSYGQTACSTCTNVIKRFYLRYLEKYGSPISNRQVNKTNAGYAFKAGIPTQDFIGTNNHLSVNFTTARRFLTNQPRTKKVSEIQQEYLYWILTDKINGNKLKTIIYFNDGRAPVVITSASFGDASNEMFCIPVGFTALNIAATDDFSKISKYTVQVINGLVPTDTSEVFTFICDKDVYIAETYFLFSNSCAGADTIRCTGSVEATVEIEKESIQITTLFNTPVVNGEFLEVSHQKSNKFKVNSGWITREAADWLEDILLAEKKFIDIDDQFVPIIISTTTQKKYDSVSTLYSYEFEYMLAFKNRATKSNI